jgi:anti-anti-sigma factor
VVVNVSIPRSEQLDGCQLVSTDDAVVVSGEIDQVNADAVAERLCAAITGSITVVDLGAVTFFSAAGVHLLAAVGAAARTADAIVHVTCSAPVWRIVDLCGAAELAGLVLDRLPDPAGAAGAGA